MDIFLVEGIQIDCRYDSLISVWNRNPCQFQTVVFFYFLKFNFCVLIRLWQILLYIVFDIFIKFFSVHHTLLPLSDHVMVHSFSADHLLSFLLISHHSLYCFLLVFSCFLSFFHCFHHSFLFLSVFFCMKKGASHRSSQS